MEFFRALLVAAAALTSEADQACPKGAQPESVCTSSLLQGGTQRLKETVTLEEEEVAVKSDPASWVAGPWGGCVQDCGGKQFRTVACLSLSTAQTMEESGCKGHRPSASRKCVCGGLFACASAASDDVALGKCPAGSGEGDDTGLDHGGFEELGCFDIKLPLDGKPLRNLYCMDKVDGAGLCLGGLPFFTYEEDSMSPEKCYKFCTGKAMDLFGIQGGSVCRCGASRLNKGVWHMEDPRKGLLFESSVLKRLATKAGGTCPLKVWRYSGHYADDGVPREMWDFNQEDLEYIDTIVAGRTIGQIIEEDGVTNETEMEGEPDAEVQELSEDPNLMHDDVKKIAGAAMAEEGGDLRWGRRRRSRRRAHRRRRAGFNRPCWPSNCGPGRGPWRTRTTFAPAGALDIWKEYVLVDYWWVNAGTTRRSLFRQAALAYRDVTCINFVERGVGSLADVQEGEETSEASEGRQELEEQEDAQKGQEQPEEEDQGEPEEEQEGEPAEQEEEQQPAGLAQQGEEASGAEGGPENDTEEALDLRQGGKKAAWGRRRRSRRRRGIHTGRLEGGACWVKGMGKGVTRLNLGWCNSMLHLGNVVHEIGHALGMNHEQKRPDAGNSYHGHGPHLTLYWNNIPSRWRPQYTQDRHSYTGSANDGPGDPHSGHAAYDFGSIMHYGGGNRYDTIPASSESLVGQRTALSAGDLEQINDMYQCIRETRRRRRTRRRRSTPAPPTPRPIQLAHRRRDINLPPSPDLSSPIATPAPFILPR